MSGVADRYARFIQDCNGCIESMQSLDSAAQSGGKVGYDAATRKFFSTKFSTTEALFGKTAASVTEQVYRKFSHAYTDTTLTELTTLNKQIKLVVTEAIALCGENELPASDRETISTHLESLKEQIEHTKEDGLNNLVQFYVVRAKDKTKDSVRLDDFRKIYQQFNADIVNAEETIIQIDPELPRKDEVALEIVRSGSLSKEHLKSTPFPQSSLQQLQVPTTVIDDTKKEVYRVLTNKETQKLQLEAAARKLNPSLDAPDIHKWKSYCVVMEENGQIQITPQATYGTSETPGHLTNIKVQHDESLKSLIITCGVIDTTQKAEEFISIVQAQLAKRTADEEKMAVRICLHQLNSYGQIAIDFMGWNIVNRQIFGEKAMIVDEHAMSRYIEESVRREVLNPDFCQKHALVQPRSEDPIVTHDNTSFNIASQLNKGEDQINQLISLEAYAARAVWALEGDSASAPLVQRVAQLRNEIIRAKLNDLPEEKIKNLQEEIKANLQALVTHLRAEANVSSLRLNFIADVLMQALPPEDELDTRVRIREVERNFLFDLMLGVIIEINCKSGLDRTGMARALYDSLMTMSKEVSPDTLAIDYLIDLVNKQDALSAKNNQLMSDFISQNNIPVMEQLEKPVAAYEGNFRADYLEFLQTQVSDPQERKDLERALHYQDLVGYHLFTVALPITQESTGVIGLKYSHKSMIGANPHPLNRVPMIMQTEDGQLIRNFYPGWTDWMGHSMTPAAIALFERLSSARGA